MRLSSCCSAVFIVIVLIHCSDVTAFRINAWDPMSVKRNSTLSGCAIRFITSALHPLHPRFQYKFDRTMDNRITDCGVELYIHSRRPPDRYGCSDHLPESYRSIYSEEFTVRLDMNGYYNNRFNSTDFDFSLIVSVSYDEPQPNDFRYTGSRAEYYPSFPPWEVSVIPIITHVSTAVGILAVVARFYVAYRKELKQRKRQDRATQDVPITDSPTINGTQLYSTAPPPSYAVISDSLPLDLSLSEQPHSEISPLLHVMISPPKYADILL